MTQTHYNLDEQLRIERANQVLETVSDPEIPVLSVLDLGVIRRLNVIDSILHVDITPTYSGCPAMKVIELSVEAALLDAGLGPVRIHTVIDPAWTTDWISEDGKRKLKEYGIAPPNTSERINRLKGESPKVACPRCGSEDTVCVSEFGSTACKAFYKCKSCLEPFDYFKCH